MTGKHIRGILAVAALAAIAAGLILANGGRYVEAKTQPVGIMGTETELTAVSTSGRQGDAHVGTAEAEKALRKVEAKLSTYLESSELSLLNASPPGETLDLSPDTLALLRFSKDITDATNGAFDPTFAPIFSLWSRSGRAGQLPSDDDLAAALAACGWQQFDMADSGASKRVDGARIDLGGIAKGYGIDRAIEALYQNDCAGGLVNVGGDIRCFGIRAEGGKWRIAVKHPFVANGQIGVLELTEGAVCTSGNYERYSVIEGQRYSHIIDPRTGRPTEANPSVTVLAPSATLADAWATALSVLGPEGLDQLPDKIEAFVVSGTPEAYRVRMTQGFAQRFIAKDDFIANAQDD